MKILKHGKYYKEHIKTCDLCGCKFEYYNSDEKDIGLEESKKFHSCWYKRDKRVRCPECGEMIKIDSFEEYTDYYEMKHTSEMIDRDIERCKIYESNNPSKVTESK